MRLIGLFNIYNALAAAASALLSGVSLADIQKSLEAARSIPGRFEQVSQATDYSVIVDYAHTPDSLENVLQTVQSFVKGHIFVVVGCGGDRDATKRPLMAQIAVQYADYPVFTSDNPRTEEPASIIRDMEKGVVDHDYVAIVDRREAITYAISEASLMM